MERSELARWARRIGPVFAVFVVVAFVAAAWYFSNVVRSDLLTPRPWSPEPDLEVISAGAGRIVLTRTELSAQDGIWGLEGDNGYGQVSSVLEVRDTEVERAFRPIEGTIEPGDAVHFEEYAFLGDPESAAGIAFRDVRVPTDGGSYPAWQIDGDRDTWVIFVHGKGDTREQALRIIPALAREGFPVLVITYRNDEGAPASKDGLYHWGLQEWSEVEAAVRFAQTKGAEEFVLMGFSMGASISSIYLHESETMNEVVAVVFDSPVLDLEEVVDAEATDRGIPGILTSAAQTLARIRFGIEWSELDQVERAGEFDPELPILIMHGSADQTVPVESIEAFAAALPDSVQLELFEGVDHVYPWNADPTRYETTLLRFLERVAADDS